MAFNDYYICDKCHNEKTFYDVTLYGRGSPYEDHVGGMKVICKKCAQTHEVVIVEKSPLKDKPHEQN